MPLISKAFSDLITFSRTGGAATYFAANGVLTTAANNEPRFDYDPATFLPRGLLIEEQRTNLITSSAVLPAGVNVTITADTFIAPDGTTTGDQILDNSTLGEHYSDSFFTPVAATNYTFSAFIKNIGASSSGFAWLRLAGDFNAFVGINLSTFTIAVNGGTNFVSSSIQAINNGWYKVSVTGLSVGTVSTVARVQVTDAANLTPYLGTGKGFAVWGRQLEAGAFPTSYIPTTSGQVTRNPDQASVNTLSPWYNATEGTLFAEYVLNGYTTGTFPCVAQLGVAGIGNRGQQFVVNVSSAQVNFNVYDDAGAYQGVGSPGGATTLNTVFKAAGAYKANDSAVSFNANAPVTDTSVTLATGINRLAIGQYATLVTPINGYLRRITYYPTRLSNAQLQTITT